MIGVAAWRSRLARSFPVYYGWAILGVSSWVSYSSRPVMAVATLSIFLVPMSEDFGWSRGVFSGAVSLGGVCAVAVSPLVGWWIDRHGSGAVVAAGSAMVGACAVGLALISQPWAFYALYVPGRMAFASPLELGTSTAVSNWFIRRRAMALALLNVTHGTGLAIMPLVAHAIILGWSWRVAWASLGAYTLAVGILPALLLMIRRPEDVGLKADPRPGGTTRVGDTPESATASASTASTLPSTLPNTQIDAAEMEVSEPRFTLRQAMGTRSLWLLAAFSAAGFMVQGGVSLHQAPHYIQQGISTTGAALAVSTFAFSQVPAGLAWSFLAARVPVRFLLALAGLCVGAGALGTGLSTSLGAALASAGTLGVGVGGLHVMLRLTWADYYGRTYLGSIRGFTLPVQIAGQAVGPIVAGFLYVATGGYETPFFIFAGAASAAGLLVLSAAPPMRRSVPGSVQ